MPVGSAAEVIATTNAMIVVNAAQQAEMSNCRAIISAFEPKGASVAAMQQYAHAVNMLYPLASDGVSDGWYKGLFVLALVGMVGGIVVTKKYDLYAGYEEYLSRAIAGFFVVPLAAVAVLSFLYGIWWLFT